MASVCPSSGEMLVEGEPTSDEARLSSTSSVEEEDQCLSLSSGASTGVVSPETPQFLNKSTLGSEGNPKESKPLLLNGSQYVQLQASTSSLNDSAMESKKVSSYLQGQFPDIYEPEEEEPLTLDDESYRFTETQEEQRPRLSSKKNREEDDPYQDHPLRQRHSARKDKLSKSTIPQKALPVASHQRSNSVLEEEGDYYPHPDDFPELTHRKKSPSAAYSFEFLPYYTVTTYLQEISKSVMRSYDPHAAATWIGFWALFLVTCSNYVLMPMRDAIALAVGVEHIPKLTLASTVLALFSSVPIGWLFEAPDPQRRAFFKNIGFTRGETQGTSLALFYRCFAMSLWSYAIGFKGIEYLIQISSSASADEMNSSFWLVEVIKLSLHHLGKAMYIAFFLVVHLMKLHSLSLLWGVATEAMEYEENARKRHEAKQEQLNDSTGQPAEKKAATSQTRLQRLAFVGFGGTVGGVVGSMIASSLARVMRISGLLVFSGLMLEAAAQLSIELGRIMQTHWMQQELFPSDEDLVSLDPSMKRSSSLGSMKRISSGNSLNRVKSMSELKTKQQQQQQLSSRSTSLASSERDQRELEKEEEEAKAEDSFSQRFLRGIRTIFQSRLLMSIFSYNALYASTTVLLSFQRAELVANRKGETSKEADTAFLANINMASSVATFALQASGAGAFVAHLFGSRGTLALMPVVRLLGVLTLAYWHQTSNGEPPNLLLFLLLDECCKVMNMAVAKPVRESLWRGLSNEARYEAKPIVDTLANRWGGGSAAFLVSSIHKLLDLFGVPEAGNGEARSVYGFPPVLFLCMVIAAWWTAVSADLGQIRMRIDMELKKMQ